MANHGSLALKIITLARQRRQSQLMKTFPCYLIVKMLMKTTQTLRHQRAQTL